MTCGDPLRGRADDKRLPLLALRVGVLGIVMHSEAMLSAFDFHQLVLNPELVHGGP